MHIKEKIWQYGCPLKKVVYCHLYYTLIAVNQLLVGLKFIWQWFNTDQCGYLVTSFVKQGFLLDQANLNENSVFNPDKLCLFSEGFASSRAD